MEARPLAELAIPGLEPSGGFAVFHQRVDPVANFLHLLEVRILESHPHLLHSPLLARQLHDLGADAPRQIAPAVLNQTFLVAASSLACGKVLQPALPPPQPGNASRPLPIAR